jgi:hypothetical protein
VALGVSPISLLMPNYNRLDAEDMVVTTGRSEPITAQRLWDWLGADHPLIDANHDVNGYFNFMMNALPHWLRLRRQELFADDLSRRQELLADELGRQTALFHGEERPADGDN